MSRKWLTLAGIALFALTSLIVSSCSKDKGAVNTDPSNTVIVKLVSTPPDTLDLINDPGWASAEETSIRIGVDAAHSNDLGVGLVKVQAISDNTNLYMKFNWRDSSQSIRPGYWSYLPDTAACPGKVWAQNLGANCTEIDNAVTPRWENEDVLALMLDMGTNGTDKADCGNTCHLLIDTTMQGLRHYTSGGTVDAWVWRAGRTDPLHLADDECWGPREQLTRHDSFTVEIYTMNADEREDNRLPIKMHSSGHGFTGNVLLEPETIPFAQDITVGWAPRDGLPGWIIKPDWYYNKVSRYDVKAKSEYDDVVKRWTVVLYRKLTTTDLQEDVNFNDGRKEYQATMAVMNHAFERHSGSLPFIIKFP